MDTMKIILKLRIMTFCFWLLITIYNFVPRECLNPIGYLFGKLTRTHQDTSWCKRYLKTASKYCHSFHFSEYLEGLSWFNFYNISRGRQSVKKTKILTTNCCVTHIKTKPLRPLEYLTLTSSFYTMIKKSMPLSPPLSHTMSCLTAVLQNLVSFFRSLTF